jgi:hypothetical protein
MISRKTIAHFLREFELDKEADKYEECGYKGIVLKCSNSRCDYQGFIPFECDLRICPRCGRRFARKIFPKYQNIIKAKLSRPEKACSLKFVTLTHSNKGKTQDVNTFQAEIREFNKRVRKFMNRLFPKSSGSGGLSVLEVGKRFNVHAHILAYGLYYPQAKLSEIWRNITDEESYIVDVRKVRGRAASVFGYLTKYIIKPVEFDNPIDYAVYLKAIKGIRRVHGFGIFYGIDPQEHDFAPECPKCGERLEFDRDFYFNIGIIAILFLKRSMGIKEIFAI